MGVTIHFDGRLRGAAEYDVLRDRARAFAAEHSWPIDEIAEERRTLSRVRNEQEWDYVGLTRGVVLWPHPNSEPLRFEFDSDLYVQEYCKTQFAGPAVHELVVDLLRTVEPLFDELTVYDEAEFWESGNFDALSAQMAWVDNEIAKLVSESPDQRVAVRLPSGRILDLVG